MAPCRASGRASQSPIHSQTTSRVTGAASTAAAYQPRSWSCSAIHWPAAAQPRLQAVQRPSASHSTPTTASGSRPWRGLGSRAASCACDMRLTFLLFSVGAGSSGALELHSCTPGGCAAKGETPHRHRDRPISFIAPSARPSAAAFAPSGISRNRTGPGPDARPSP